MHKGEKLRLKKNSKPHQFSANTVMIKILLISQMRKLCIAWFHLLAILWSYLKTGGMLQYGHMGFLQTHWEGSQVNRARRNEQEQLNFAPLSSHFAKVTK